MSKKPIKSSLFRFVTLRSPQAIEDKENKAGFVLPSDTVKGTDTITALSAYYLAIDGVDQTDEAAKRTALEGANSDPSFILIDGKTSLKTISSDLYTFSSWLMRNKNYLTYESVASNMPDGYLAGTLTDVVLNTAEEARVWDNLLYQTIYKTSVTLREGLIQMLITNQFVQDFKAFHDTMSAGLAEGEVVVFTDQDEKEFVKRANASVVIEKEVLLSSEVETVEAVEELPSITKNYLQQELKISLAKESIASYTKALEELRKEEAIYNNRSQEKYETELEVYVTAARSEMNTNKTVDSTSGETTYAESSTAKFEYIAPNLNFQSIDGEFFTKEPEDPSTSITSETIELLEGKEFESTNSFSEVYDILNGCISTQKAILTENQLNETKTFSLGGSTFSLSPQQMAKEKQYCYAGVLQRKVKSSAQKIRINLEMVTGRQNSYATNPTFNLVNDSTSTPLTILSSSLTNNEGEKILYSLIVDNTAVLTNGTYTLSGTLNFVNGDIVDFSSKIIYFEKPATCGFMTEYFFTGCGNLQGGSGSSNTTITKPTLKGVFNLGIADYRRVEQEVCCYVPGEVSHIENILAKEYKEKSTRSLISSEFTTEQTSEKESEVLTDTTSTERNELSSEVSSVIDQQNSQDYGATTSVDYTGKNLSLGASASFGGSSSNASSLSNSEAQNYAQEVTERALERVVQKVSSKRTSRVLREFEENNTHGFDNRKGEKHVTGVYRWVDKIYENQIVNYGKRLMYEFSIPEPSRYLKEALFTQPDSDTLTNLGLIELAKPAHPNTLVSGNTFTAKDITKDNYQRFASRYNAEVNPYPREYSIGKSMTTNIFDRSKQRYTAIEDEIQIPEGYVCYSASSVGQMMFHLDNPENPKIIATVGDVTVDHLCNVTGNLKIARLNSKTHTLGKSYYNSIPVAAMFYDVEKDANVSFTVDLKPSPEGIEQWQNETFNSILNAYYSRVNEYNDTRRANQDLDSDSDGEQIKFNPAFNRSMEKREFKRLAIELMTKSTDITVSRDNFAVVEGSQPVIDDSDEFQKHSAVVKFFEQAFDWEIMSYQLYPYYYADKKNWKELITQKEDADPIFQAFMQSGMSRMVVPVRPGFETAVNWYMSTGEIWNGQGLVTDINDDLYLSIADEMLEPVGEPVGLPWKTQVPTSLTIVQGKSVFLDDGGLPCHTDCGEESQFGESTYVISGDTGSNASDGVGADTVGEDNNVV